MIILGGNYRNFGTVFQLQKEDNYVDCNLSTSEKIKNEGSDEYKNKNSYWDARFVGKAKTKAMELNEADRIEILYAKFENIYNKEKKKKYLNLVVYDIKTPAELQAERDAIANSDPNA